MANRKVIDCSKVKSEKNCTLKISGKEEEIMPVAVHHAVTFHGHQDTPELRNMIRGALEDDKS